MTKLLKRINYIKLNLSKKKLIFVMCVLIFSILLLAVVLQVSINWGNVRDDKIVATVNGHEVSVKEFKYFFSTVRSSVINDIYNSESKSNVGEDAWKSTIGGKTAGEFAKEKTMEKLIEYDTLLTKAVELGIIDFKDTPFYGNNLEKMKSNDTLYGPEIKSKEMIVNDFVNKIKENIIEKLYNERKIDEKELQSYFNENKEKYKLKDDIKIRRLFLKYIDENDKVDNKLKREKSDLAAKLLSRIKAGENFEGLVLKYSEDKSFQNSKGMQTISHDGKIDRFIELVIVETSFALDVNEVSDVIDMGTGFLIIRCEERKPIRGPVFSEVRTQVLRDFRSRKYEDEFDKWKNSVKMVVNEDVYKKIKLE